MNRKLFNYSKKLLLGYRQGGKLAIDQGKPQGFINILFRDYCFGKVQGGYLSFTDADRQALLHQVKQELNLDLLTEEHPQEEARITKAKTARNEKQHSYAVARNFVLVNTLDSFCLNKQVFPRCPINALGIQVNSEQLFSVEHQYIVLVENLAVMAHLADLHLPEVLKKALWLYRGDVKTSQQTATAYQFFRRFQHSHHLVCFSDLDPKGLEISLTSGADSWLTVKTLAALDLPLHGDEYEWDKQANSIHFLDSKLDQLPSSAWLASFEAMKLRRKTLKQEHILAHQLALTLLPIANVDLVK